MQIKNNLPPAPIYYLAIQKNFKDLAIATYGRGFYILDDISAIRSWAKDASKNKIMLYPIRNAYRFNMKTGIHAEYTMSTGSNPPYGASINYFLPDSIKEVVNIFVLNNVGDTIQHIKGSNEKGINRVWWNLAHDEIVLPKLKTIPDNKSFVKLDSNGNRNMFIYDLDIAPGLESPRVPPGTYTVVLKAGDVIQKSILQVLIDPNSKSKQADILAQYQYGKDLYKNIKQCLSIIEKMEIKRALLLKEATAASLAMDKKILDLEKQLFDVHLTGARMDIFRNPAQILERMLSIGKESMTNGADFPPTTQHQAVFNALKAKMKEVENEYNKLKL
jgi:hypothetical protein